MLGGYSELTPVGLANFAKKQIGVKMCVKTDAILAIHVAGVSCWHVGR